MHHHLQINYNKALMKNFKNIKRELVGDKEKCMQAYTVMMQIGNSYLRFANGILVDIPRFSFLCAKINSLNPSGKRRTENSILIDSTSTVLDIGLLKNTKGIEGVLF